MKISYPYQDFNLRPFSPEPIHYTDLCIPPQGRDNCLSKCHEKPW